MCAACGWPGFKASPWDAGGHNEEHCPCCGFWFGPWDYQDWRYRWLGEKGGAWSAKWRPQPANWDRDAQIAAIEANAAGVADWFEFCVKGVVPVRDVETAEGLAVTIFGTDDVSTETIRDQALAGAARAKNIDRFRVRLVGSDSRLADLKRHLPDELLGWAIERRDLPLGTPGMLEPATDGSAWADAAVSMAPEMAAGFQDLGFPLDMTVETLPELERVFDRRFMRPFPPQGLPGTTGYVGEVIRRAAGGRWIGPTSPLVMDYGLTIQLPDGSRIWPRQRLAKRLGPIGKAEPAHSGPASPFQEAVKAVIRPYMHEGRSLFSMHAYAAGLGLSPTGPTTILDLKRVVGL